MIESIQENPDLFIPEEVHVDDFFKEFSSINDAHVDLVDVLKPFPVQTGLCNIPTGDPKRNVTIKLNSCGIGPSLNSGHALANVCRTTTLDNKRKPQGPEPLRSIKYGNQRS